jgi:DeoR/GlpR family transcriptional regulator of sugar metabolism
VRAKTLFLSATGLILPEGITDPNPLEIEVKRAMAASAERVVLLLDSSKFSVRSMSVVLPLEKIDVLITNADAPPEYLEHLSRRMDVLTA